MSGPEISVIIISFNNPQYLRECLESIYRSSLKNFEVLVIDNNSTDKQVVLELQKFPEVKIFQLNKNVGFAAASNYGINKSHGQYLFFLNNDTTLETADWSRSILFFSTAR